MLMHCLYVRFLLKIALLSCSFTVLSIINDRVMHVIFVLYVMHEHGCFVSNMFASRPYFIDNVSADVKDWGYPTHTFIKRRWSRW